MIELKLVLESIGIITLSGLLSGVYPALKAERIKP